MNSFPFPSQDTILYQGYDVLFPCLDAAGAGVAAAAQDSGNVKVVGAVADYAKDYGAKDVTAGSVVFAWDELGYLETKGELCDGKSHVLGMKENGIRQSMDGKSGRTYHPPHSRRTGSRRHRL